MNDKPGKPTDKSNPVRWGFVGTGNIASWMAAVVGATPAAKLCAVASRDIARADSARVAAALPPGSALIEMARIVTFEAEFARVGVDFDARGRRLIDMQTIFHREEPRDLTAAARFYLDRDHHGDA